MSEKRKVMDLFGKNQVVQNMGVKYSELLSDFMEPFEPDFPKDFDMGDVFGFAVNAWNMANMSQNVPKAEFDRLISENPMPADQHHIFKKMLDHKNIKFKDYDRYIQNFEIKEDNKNGLRLEVMTIDGEMFLMNMMNEMDNRAVGVLEARSQEGYLNRSALVIMPKNHFLIG